MGHFVTVTIAVITTPMLLVITSTLRLVPQPEARLAIMPLSASNVPEGTVSVLDELLLHEVHALHAGKTIGGADLAAALGAEKLSQSCHEVSCAAEIGGALGVTRLLSAHAGVLGDELVLSGKVIDVAAGEVRARATVRVPNQETSYTAGLRQLVERLLLAAVDVKATVDLDAFLAAGLDARDFDELHRSGLTYWEWGRERNDESFWLDLGRWTFTGMTGFFCIIAVAEVAQGERLEGALIGTGIGYAVATAGLWILDLYDIGAVPPILEGTAPRASPR